MKRSRLLSSVQFCVLVLLVLSTAVPAVAGHFARLVAFGDSLSDTGAVFAVTQGAVPPSPPYYAGRFSNGPVWPEYLGAALSLPVENFAYGGAQTDHANLFDGLFGIDYPGLSDEIALFRGRPLPSIRTPSTSSGPAPTIFARRCRGVRRPTWGRWSRTS